MCKIDKKKKYLYSAQKHIYIYVNIGKLFKEKMIVDNHYGKKTKRI